MLLNRSRATIIGLVAILLWSLLALLTAASGAVPPFQLAAMSFSIGSMLGVIHWLIRPGSMRSLRQPWAVWLLGIGGLFGYHFFYFTALRLAPAVEAGLIAYLWPLLIVLFSALLPGERLRVAHVLGALLGLAGTALIVTGGTGVSLQMEYLPGYGAALLCAFLWSGYSVLSRRFSEVPTAVVTGFCLATALLSLTGHLLLETTVWPKGAVQWLAVAGLGLGPVGLAFFVWDIGVKNGDIQVLGALSYLAPLLSTLILIATGFGKFSIQILLACLLITGGAAVAASAMRRR